MPFRAVTCQRAGCAVLLTMALVTAGLILPGMIDTREMADRMACSNNLRQIGLACHNYSDIYKSLPPGWWGAVPETGGLTATTLTAAGPMPCVGPGNGPLFQLLPFLSAASKEETSDEKLTKSGLWDTGKSTIDFWHTNHHQEDYTVRALEIAAQRFYFLQCPSDSDAPNTAQRGTKHYQTAYVVGTATFNVNHGGVAGDPKTSRGFAETNWGTSGPGEWSSYFLYDSFNSVTQPYNPFARVNYQPVAGLGHGESPFYRQFEGVFTDHSAVTLADISKADGTSFTLLFGETCGRFHPNFGDDAFQHNLFSACGAPTHRGLYQRCSPRTPPPEASATSECDDHTFMTGFGQRARFGTFRSTHPGGVQFCLCDGAVRTIARGQTWVKGSLDWYLLQELAGYHDGFYRDCTALVP